MGDERLPSPGVRHAPNVRHSRHLFTDTLPVRKLRGGRAVGVQDALSAVVHREGYGTASQRDARPLDRCSPVLDWGKLVRV
jgi:hypothetical protein